MEDFASLQSSVQSALLDTTRSAIALASQDLPFHRTVDLSIGTALETQNARLLSLANRLLGSATAHADNVRPTLRDIEDVEGNWAKVVDVVDSLLERADTALDEFTGAVKRLSPREQTPTAGKVPSRPSRISAALKAQDIEKPQLLFENLPANHETEPFRPLLLNKPHASVPLENEPFATDEDSQLQYPHPYQLEIEQYQYPGSVYTYADPIKYDPFETTTATLVETEEALHEMLEELKKAKEIAIDLEHHDSRSYVGIVSLMQISTRDRDWIVDTLRPWRRKLQVLNEVFTDPSIVKVLHGAHMDMIWLQRDLGLYVVGLFDTHHASRALGYPGGSYAYLLQRFTGVTAQKQYQTADWRIRPLPQELLDYARSDTHYLLYIYDNMRNELIERSDFSVPDHEKDKVHDVCERSKEYALQRYEHPIYDFEYGQGPGGWFKLVSRTPANFSKEQFAVFRALHQWRDDVAREQDDSVHYVMPSHMLFALPQAMPTNRAELLSAAQPATQTIRLRADELVAVIAKAKKGGATGPDMLELLAQIDPRQYKKALERATTNNAKTSEGFSRHVPHAANGIASTLPLRSATSMFWGGKQQQQRPISTLPDIQMSIPMPPLTAEIFAETAPVPTPPQPSAPVSRSSPKPLQAEDPDATFILSKNKAKKRKHAEVAPADDALATQSDEVALPTPEIERLQAKADRKAAKKEAKRAAKAAEAMDVDGSDLAALTSNGAAEVEEEEAFDYANAPSVLNPPKLTKEQMKAEQKARKKANPYSKSADVPKGMPRAQKERAGRSMTFKR